MRYHTEPGSAECPGVGVSAAHAGVPVVAVRSNRSHWGGMSLLMLLKQTWMSCVCRRLTSESRPGSGVASAHVVTSAVCHNAADAAWSSRGGEPCFPPSHRHRAPDRASARCKCLLCRKIPIHSVKRERRA